MKIAICGDIHWSQYSSIIRSQGKKYSTRLENLIKSINWFNNLAVQYNCEKIIFLGDFFDKAELNAMECTALNEINWPNIKTYFLCGNHEMASVNHEYSSAKVLQLLSNGDVVDDFRILGDDSFELCFLPYQLESIRKPLEEYFGKSTKKRLILSHNDIAGIQYGGFLSKSGFSIEEIEANCDKFINGHLHNGDQITKKIINIGNLSGGNFSEDASKYDHVIFIFDTDTFSIDVFENPYAFNFYKLDATEKKINFNKLKANSIISLKCNDVDNSKYRELIENNNNILESRLVLNFTSKQNQVVNTEIENLSVDHLAEFKKFIIDTLGNNETIIAELNEICK